MKNIFLIIIILVLIFACGDNDNKNTFGKLQIYTSVYPICDFTKKIGGEKIAVYKDQLTSSIKAILDLEDGSRVDAGEANFIQELKVGDDFGSTNVEVVIRGDKVIEINHAE